MKAITNCSFWLYLLLQVYMAKGQSSSYNFDHITTANGLSNNKVESVLQDSHGFYWITTSNGLNRFDGSSFKVFFNDARDSTSLTHNACHSLLEDRNGDIWITTYKGVSRYLKKKGYFQQIYLTHPLVNFERANRTTHLILDRDGNIWFTSYGLWKYDLAKEKLFLYQHIQGNPVTLSNNLIVGSMQYDERNNGIWLTAGYELNFFDISKNEFYHNTNNPHGWKVLAENPIGPLVLDKKNRLWFQDINAKSLSFFDIAKNMVSATRPITHGVRKLCLDDKGKIWICFWLARTEIYDPEVKSSDTSFFTTIHSRSARSENATRLYVDRSHNYWIPSGKGISVYNEKNQFYKLFQLSVTTRGAEEELFKITAIAQTDKDNVWLGTNCGLYKFDLETHFLKKIDVPEPSPKTIWALYADNGRLWAGYKEHVILYDIKKENQLKSIKLDIGTRTHFIRKGMQNDLWVGIWSGGLYRINTATYDTVHFVKGSTPTTISTNSIISGLVDGNNLWLGYNTDGFARYDFSSGIFSGYYPWRNNSVNSSEGTINTITKTSDGKLWMGTHGGGLFEYNLSTKNYVQYRQQDGLNSNFINSVFSDRFNNLWISTPDGINYFNHQQKVINNINIGLVFSSNDSRHNGTYGINDKIYFFCGDQFVEIDPAAYFPYKGFYDIVISSFKIFEKEIPLSVKEPIELTHDQNFFSFEFSALKSNLSEEIEYAYLLEGFDKNWNNAGNRSYASYTNVPGGDYHFKVKTKNAYGIWSNVLLDIPLTIHPPFWKTPWFLILCFIAFASSIYLLFRYRINQLKKVITLRNKISQDLHDDVASTLSGIRLYSEMAKDQLNKHHISKVQDSLEIISSNASDMSKDMSDIIWTINPGNDTINRLLEKLKNYARELTSVKKTVFTMNVNDNLENDKLNMEQRRNIYLICKEAIHNSIKYAEAKHLQIDVFRKEGYVNIIINDDGAGFNTLKHHDGNGLKNMNERAKEIGAYFTITSHYEQGTEVQLKVRL